MSYQHLSIEERIQKASEYAVLLTADERPEIDIVSELSLVFELTREQATEACVLMRKNFNNEYQLALSSKIRNAWYSVAVIGMMLAGCYFIAAELAGVYFLFVALFAMGLIGALGMIAKWTADKKRSVKDLFPLNRNYTGNTRQVGYIGEFVLFFLLLTVVSAYIYSSGSGLTDSNEITIVKDLVLSGNAETRSTRGKNPDHYFLLQVKGNAHPLKFLDDYYSYGTRGIAPWDFPAGDTIAVMMKTEKALELKENAGTQPLSIYNVQLKGTWLIDLEERNRLKKAEDRKNLLLFGGLMIAAVLLFILGQRYLKRIKL
jgi:hypothetical protein